ACLGRQEVADAEDLLQKEETGTVAAVRNRQVARERIALRRGDRLFAAARHRSSLARHRKSNATLIAPVVSCWISVIHASRQSSSANVCVSMPVRSIRPDDARSR